MRMASVITSPITSPVPSNVAEVRPLGSTSTSSRPSTSYEPQVKPKASQRRNL